MCADSGCMRHRVTHQPADAAVAVRKRMDVIEAMVGSCHGHDPAGLAHAIEAVARLEVVHEIIDARTGWRLMTADRDIFSGARTPFAGPHQEFSAFAVNE